MENYKAKAEIMKINMDDENVGGLGVETTKNEDKQGENLHENKFFPEFL